MGHYAISCAGNSNPNYSVTYVDGTLTVNPKALTGSFTAADKVYDGTRQATVETRSVPGVIEHDEVSFEVENAEFENKTVGSAKTVSADLSLSGPQADNYRLSSSTAVTEADIMPKSLTGSFTAADKVYDGTVEATITNRWLFGVVPGEDVSLAEGRATFASPQAGAGKIVTASGFSLAGADAHNYVLATVFDDGEHSAGVPPFGLLQPRRHG